MFAVDVYGPQSWTAGELPVFYDPNALGPSTQANQYSTQYQYPVNPEHIEADTKAPYIVMGIVGLVLLFMILRRG